jgi:hypothetical protein
MRGIPCPSSSNTIREPLKTPFLANLIIEK